MKLRTLTTKEVTFLARPNLSSTVAAFAEVAKLSRKWDTLVGESIASFGDVKGSHVSGIYGEHFPDARKNELRTIARTISALSEKAHATRAKGVHVSSVRKARMLVIARDGSGFYG